MIEHLLVLLLCAVLIAQLWGHVHGRKKVAEAEQLQIRSKEELSDLIGPLQTEIQSYSQAFGQLEATRARQEGILST